MNDKLLKKAQDTENDMAALREGNERYHLLMELAADGMIIVQDGVIKESNNCMVKLSSYGPEAIMDTALTGYFPPDVKGIVSSGYSDDPGMTDYKQYGFSGVVAKSYTLEELGEKLSRVLKS